MAKKSTNAKSKKNIKNTGSINKKKKTKLNENFWALIALSISIILTLLISMPNIGFIGGFIKYIVLALFSKFFYVLFFIVASLSIYKLIHYNTYSFRQLNKIDTLIFILMLMFMYVTLNIGELQDNNTISIRSFQNIVNNSQNGIGLGLVSYLLSILFYKLIGKTGIVLFFVFALIYLIIKYKKQGLLTFLGFAKLKIKEKKTTKENRLKDKQTLIKEHFSDPPTYDDIDIKSKVFLKYDSDEDAKKDIENKINIYGDMAQDDNGIQTDENDAHANADVNTDVIKEDDIQKTGIIEEKDTASHQIEDDKKEIPTLISGDIKTSQGLKLGNIIKKTYKKPTISLLNDYKKVNVQDKEKTLKNAQSLTQTLASFGVEAKVENISVGPTITRYELKPKIGTKVSKITNLTEDLALSLAAKTIRIEAPIPGKSFIGVEVPNEVSQTVSFKEVIKTCIDKKDSHNIAFAMGKDISGEVVLSDITKMPHVLIAGSTGSGKSVCINTIICSIIYNYSPEEVKLILIDPKVVELSIYNKLPHLIIPVVTDMKKTPQALTWAVNEMEKRYSLFAENKSKDINSYNQKNREKLPRIVIIIDELADLMMVAPKDIEEAICRLAQKARACGIHLIVATQRPSVDVITGLIKANIPSRIAFAVSSQTDSRTILDSSGAEKLLGKGDMLYSPIGMNKPIRIQGAFLTEEEVEKITEFIELNNPIENLQEKQEEVVKQIEDIVIETEQKSDDKDKLYDFVVEFALEHGEISVSLVQRQFKIGYNRASRIVEEMERNGIVGKSDGSKPRKILIQNK